ncbi:hypothetical protein TNCV_2755581 [Trichonephila clavipes]|nr:hypothetical protein TNCV_2755581 [Trichonephila clavipes]
MAAPQEQQQIVLWIIDSKTTTHHDLARSTPIFRDNTLRSGQRHPTFFLSPLTSSEDLRIDEYLECPSATQVAYTYKHVFSDIRTQVARCSVTNHHSEWASERLCC